MKPMTLIIMGTLALAGCSDRGAEPTGHSAAAATLSPGPMPDLTTRLNIVVAELGPLVPAVQSVLPVANGVLLLDRRDALQQVGPVCRASMRRHAVTVEQLARHLGGIAE